MKSRFFVLPVFFLLFLFVFTIPCSACHLFGAIGTSSTDFNDALSEYLDDLRDEAIDGGDVHGWAIIYYYYDGGTLTYDVIRSDEDIDDEATEFSAAISDVISEDPVAVLAHTRYATAVTGIDDPHPFIYAMNDTTWSFIHNGYFGSPGEAWEGNVANIIGANFAALDIFRTEPLTYWNDDPGILDSKLYSILMMKNIMIDNTYRVGNDYRLNNTYAKLAYATGVDDYFNSILSDGHSLYVIRNVAAASYGLYEYINSTDDYSIVMKYNDGNEGIEFDEVEATHYYYYMNGGDEHLEGNFGGNGYWPQTSFYVNNETSSGQYYPRISTGDDGSFVTVWRTSDGYHIKARWLNQMAMVENLEFQVDQTATGYKYYPDVKHDPSTGDILVAWSEREVGDSYPTLIKTRRFEWNSTTRIWEGENEETIYDGITRRVDQPRIAFADHGGYVIVFENDQELWAYGKYDDWGSLATRPAHEIVGITGDQFYDPDVAWIGNSTYLDRYAVTWSNNSTTAGASGVYACHYNPYLASSSVPTQIESMANPGYLYAKPSITRSSLNNYMIVYYERGDLDVRVKRLTVNGGFNCPPLTLTTHSLDVTGTTANPVIAKHSNYKYTVAYHDYDSGQYKTFIVPYSNGFGTPVEITDNTQTSTNKYPAIAISHNYPEYGALDYETYSDNDDYEERVVVVWQSYGHDGSSYGIAGRLKGYLPDSDEYFDWWDPSNNDDFAGTSLLSSKNGGDTANLLAVDEDTDDLNLSYGISEIYPNPFNPTTSIRYSLPAANHVQIAVYDVTGRLVQTLYDGNKQVGTHSIEFDGSKLSSGVYFVRFLSGSKHEVRKIVLTK